MPVVFQGCCSACGYDTPPVTAGGPCVLVTDADEDRRRRIGEPVPVVLHPLAPYVLDEFGLSFASAAWGGRLVEVRQLVCRDCGRAFERRWLTAGGVPVGCGGCLGIVAAGGLAAAATAVIAENPFLGLAVGGLTGAGLLAAIELGGSPLVRRRYPHRAAAVRTSPACPDCGSRAGIPVDRLRGPVPCPRCGTRALNYLPAGSEN
jgi:hypothetical protein